MGGSLLSGIGALAGAGGSIFSALQGGALNAAMLREAALQRQLQQQIARQQYELATAGSQDARGNRVRYVPGVGWTTEPSPTTRSIIGASDKEELARLQEDAPRARRGARINETRRMQESGIADALLREIGAGVGDVSVPQMSSRLAEVLLADQADKGRFASNAIGMQAARTGEQGNAELVAREIGKNALTGARSALARARYDAPTEANRQNAELRGSNLSRYNLLAGRASNSENFPFSPTQVAAVPEASSARSLVMGPQALSGASAALGRGGELYNAAFKNYMGNRPNYGLMAGGITEALENIMRSFRGGGSSRTPPIDYTPGSDAGGF